MIGLVRCTESRKLIRMSHPVKIAAIYDRSAKGCSMSIHIFRGRMCHNISSPFNRPQIHRRRERIIHDQRNSVCMGCFCKLLDIKYRQSRIGNGLAKYHLCVLLKCCV